LENIEKLYTEIGGEFLTDLSTIKEKLSKIKAFIFDWDGVFNNAVKNESGSSNFNEADSMGTNLLRFSHYLDKSEVPLTAIISGEKNSQSFFFTKREHFNSCYFKISNKIEALNHFCNKNGIKPEEVCYFFDDVLDLSIAQICGVRMMMNRNAGVLFKQYVKENKLTDYITANDGGHYGVREACELLMGISGNFNECIKMRTDFNDKYKMYLSLRNKPVTYYYTSIEGVIKEEHGI
jgi:3-deoxy-D-manno-octulosonate 8-phosphate phosphatase (KDO 8-P phosphatase)